MSIIETPPGALFSNWSETEHCVAARFYKPTTEAELCALVAGFEQRGETVRVVGAGHAFSPVVLTKQNLISLDNLKNVINVDQTTKRVTVQAGIRLKELNEILPSHGLAMTNLGSIAEQSIAGATSTGTHGTGITLGNVATQIVGLNIVTGGGKLLSLTIDNDRELMLAARQALGCLGIVTQVTIQCVDAFRLKSTSFPMPFDDALNQLDTLLNQYRHLRFYWLAGVRALTVLHRRQQ